jgi:hypothetical protein
MIPVWHRLPRNGCSSEASKGTTQMCDDVSHKLRLSIEKLINAKLCDALSHHDGLSRLIAHRSSGVASTDIRSAERVLDDVLRRSLFDTRNSHVSDRAEHRTDQN